MDDQTAKDAILRKEPTTTNDKLGKGKARARPKKRRASIRVSTAKKTPWTFPKNTLEDAVRVPKAIEEKAAGNPLPAADLAGI